MNVSELINRATVLCARLPQRDVEPGTAKSYRRTLARMLRESGGLDPLRDGDAKGTYQHRRASLHFGGRWLVLKLIDLVMKAAENNDPNLETDLASKLAYALDVLEPALERDPPLPSDASSLDMPASRWQNADQARPRPGAGSKKHVLGRLPVDWTQRIWAAAPVDWKYKEALAVHLLTPCRPEELVPGMRPHGWSPGVKVELCSAHLLEITIQPVKTHRGKYGSPSLTISYDPTVKEGPASYLAKLCQYARGPLIFSIESKNAMRKSVRLLGCLALPDCVDTITPYVFRHQLTADLKATVGAGEQVASAAGHCNDRTQAGYGRREHGRKSKGFISARSARPPRLSNIFRARALGQARQEQQNSKDVTPSQI